MRECLPYLDVLLRLNGDTIWIFFCIRIFNILSKFYAVFERLSLYGCSAVSECSVVLKCLLCGCSAAFECQFTLCACV